MRTRRCTACRARSSTTWSSGVTDRLQQDDGDRRHRVPRAGEGLGPRVRARLQPPRPREGPGGHHLPRRGARRASSSRASTSSRSARSRPTSSACAVPTPTRARASATRVRSCAARPGRQVSDGSQQRSPSGRGVRRASPPPGVRARHVATSGCASGSSARQARPRLVVNRSARHLFAQIVDDRQGTTLASASTYKLTEGDKTAQAPRRRHRARRGGQGRRRHQGRLRPWRRHLHRPDRRARRRRPAKPDWSSDEHHRSIEELSPDGVLRRTPARRAARRDRQRVRYRRRQRTTGTAVDAATAAAAVATATTGATAARRASTSSGW